MRRPSPLPPPERPDTGPDERPDDVDVARSVQPPRARADDVRQAAEDDTTTPPASGDGNETVDLGSPEDLLAASPRRPALSGEERPEQTGAAADDEPQPTGELRARDVWAAARARRKALRAEVRRFTARQRRRRRIWIASLSALLVLIAGSAAAAYSPLFAVEKVTVIGADQLSAATVADALSGQMGRPLPLVDSSEVKAALVTFPLVESYTLEARPPHELVVRIVERTPIGSIESDAGYTLVDAAGVALSTTPEKPDGYPIITAKGGAGSSAFLAVGRVFRALPTDIQSQVTAMSATTPNDVTLTLGETDTDVFWGNADDSAEKARVLEAAMVNLPPSEVSVYDVSSPSAIVVR